MSMYIKLKIHEDFIRKAIRKAGSYRKLSKELNIPQASLHRYLNRGSIPEERFNSIVKYSKIKEKEKLIEKKLPTNFRQCMGGLKCIIAKKEKGTFDRDMKKLQDIQSEKLKKWHKFMKLNKPRKYYTLQYKRFKKISGYKYKTNRGEDVRNIFEKQIADILAELNIDYKYEPLIKIDNKYFFPDFLIKDKIIIECTMWKGPTKAYNLLNKVNILKRKYNVFVVIPKNLYMYYKMLNNHLILGLDEFAPVAQTFLKN